MIAIFDVSTIEKKIGYKFKDKSILRQSFTHSSYVNEHKSESDNELLEFFGDTVIQFIVTEWLYENKKGTEGALTIMRQGYVSNDNLIKAVMSLKIDEHILLGEGMKSKISKQDKIYGSLYEALTAAIYKDGGMESAKAFVVNTLITLINKRSNKKVKAVKAERITDYKSELQMYIQKNKKGSISYEQLSKSGPDHAPIFRVAVLLNGKSIAEGKGSSKKLAEAESAKKALTILKKTKR